MYTGMCIGEVLALTWKQLNLNENTLMLSTQQIIEIDLSTLEMLKQRSQIKESTYTIDLSKN